MRKSIYWNATTSTCLTQAELEEEAYLRICINIQAIAVIIAPMSQVPTWGVR